MQQATKGIEMKRAGILILMALMLTAFKANAQEIFLKVRYGTHERQYVDVYLPNPSLVPKGLIIWIHGGSWNAGDVESDRESMQNFFVNAFYQGYAVMAVNYRLVGQGGEFPNNVQDITSVLAAVENLGCRNCPDGRVWVRLDPYVRNGVLVSGGSAGGHLAVMGVGTYLNGKARASSSIRCVNDNYGPLDMRPLHLYQPAVLPVIRALANGASMNDISPTYYQELGVIDRISLNSRFGLKWIINYNHYDKLVPAATIEPFVKQLQRSGRKVSKFESFETADENHGVSTATHTKVLADAIKYCFSPVN